MRLRDDYDWIVLGDSPGALMTAGLVAKLGLSVLVVPLQKRSWVGVLADGIVFDPESNVFLGLGKTSERVELARQALSRISITDEEFNASVKAPNVCDLAGPEFRLTLHDGFGRIDREIQRELGKEFAHQLNLERILEEFQSQILDYWGEYSSRLSLGAHGANPVGANLKSKALTHLDFFAKLSQSARKNAQIQSGFLRSHKERPSVENGPSDRLVEILEGLRFNSSGSLFGEGDLTLGSSLFLLTSRVSAFRGGVNGFRRLLLNAAARCGAHVPQGIEWRRVFVENGKLVGVQLSDRNHVISATGAAFTCSLSELQNRMTKSGREWPFRVLSAPKPSHWRFTVAVRVRKVGIPPGFGHRLVWSEAGAPPLEIEVSDPTDYDELNSETSFMYLRTLLPFSANSLDYNYQKLMAARMFRQATEIFPFLEYHVTRIFPDFRGGDLSEFRQAHPFDSDLEKIPVELRCYQDEGKGARCGVEGLFSCSNEAYPELGSFGSIVAAYEATAWISQRMGVAHPFE